jgi:hypothetical protein
MMLFELLAVLVGQIFVLITLGSLLFVPNGVYFLDIVLSTKASNA